MFAYVSKLVACAVLLYCSIVYCVYVFLRALRAEFVYCVCVCIVVLLRLELLLRLLHVSIASCVLHIDM